MTTFHCRSCGKSHGRLVLDLGIQPLANKLLQTSDLSRPELKFPLRLFVCESCWLLQIVDIVPPVNLFSEYLYFSSVSEALLSHAKEAAERYLQRFRLNADSLVVEVASNDGYLLGNFVAAKVPCLGIEPASNIAKVAREKGIETLNDFFNSTTATALVQQGRKADLLLGNNVFAHVPDTNDFVRALGLLLKSTGSVVLEFPYACDLIEHSEFDTIYHEHVFYFTLTALIPLFARHSLEIYDVERLTIHGGSLRLFAGHRNTHPVDPKIGETLDRERSLGVNSSSYYECFSWNVLRLRRALGDLLRRIKSENRSIAAYGASAKGSTLLNFYGLGKETLDFVVDRSPHKQGRLTPGSHLPILSPDALVEQKPDFALLLTWNFAEEILRQQQSYRSLGGKFIVPIPEVRII